MERECASSSSSSDEEEDSQILILQNDRKLPTHHSHSHSHSHNHSRHSFHIEGLRSRIASRFPHSLSSFASANKWCLLSICLPLLLLVAFFSTGLRNLFPFAASTSLEIDSLSARTRESQLQALYLLNRQQSGLLSLWNRTTTTTITPANINNTTSIASTTNSTSSPLSPQDLNAALLKQISLNKEIQQALLSAHRTGNSSSGDQMNNGDPIFGLDQCRKVDQKLFSQRRTMDWKPKSDKFLLAICLSGQMSNHLICLEKHMFFAALLDRVLVIPSSRVDYQYHRVLDIDHINKCFGRKVAVTFEEFSGMKKNRLHIDRFICYFSSPQPCYVDEEHLKKLKSLGISMAKLEPAWNEDAKKPSKRTAEDVKAKFSTKEDVIAIGDVFYADLEQEWVMQPGGPLAHKCRTLVEPSRLIMLTAQRFIQTFLGKNFISLHFRRHGFLKFCNAKSPSCFFPVPQAADCISRVVERANAPVIYLSTDAAESETSLLQSLVVLNGKVVPLVKRPARNSAEKWDALLYRHGLEQDTQVEAMLDKTICAMSHVFIGSSGSTFTEDILRLRKDWGSASICDEYLCQGEQPNFIADNE